MNIVQYVKYQLSQNLIVTGSFNIAKSRKNLTSAVWICNSLTSTTIGLPLRDTNGATPSEAASYILLEGKYNKKIRSLWRFKNLKIFSKTMEPASRLHRPPTVKMREDHIHQSHLSRSRDLKILMCQHLLRCFLWVYFLRRDHGESASTPKLEIKLQCLEQFRLPLFPGTPLRPVLSWGKIFWIVNNLTSYATVSIGSGVW